MINYRIAKEEDYKNINDFHNRIYRSHRTTEQFYWEFHQAPAGPSIYIIAEDGEKVIGTQCAIPINLITFEGERIFSGKSEDTLVDPDYRGQNIFNKLYEILFKECSRQGMKVIWGFTSAIKPFIKMGFEIPFDHKQVLAVNKVVSSYNHLSALNKKNKAIDKLKIFGLCCLSKTRYKLSSKDVALGKFFVSRESVTNVWELLASNLKAYPCSYSIGQTEEYQKWRIYDNPNYYKVHTFAFRNSNQELVGVIYANSHPDGVAFIIQSLFHYELATEIKLKFIHIATASLFSEGISLIRNWVFDHNPFNKDESDYFQRANYYKVDKGVSLVWKKLDGASLDAAGFFLSRIATQGVI